MLTIETKEINISEELQENGETKIIKGKRLDTAMEELDNKMATNKELMFDKEYVKVKKDTFDSMNKVIKETKKVMELKPKIQKVYEEVDTYAKRYKTLERQKDNIAKEVELLRYKNHKLENENRALNDYIKSVIEVIKEFFKKMLNRGNEFVKEETVVEVKSYYDCEDFSKDDVYDIAKDTTKEQELFDYAKIGKHYSKDKDDFDIGI